MMLTMPILDKMRSLEGTRKAKSGAQKRGVFATPRV
jgi:hypothetical protein